MLTSSKLSSARFLILLLLFLFNICWLLGSCYATVSSASLTPSSAPLFVLLLDGLRWDYPLDSNLTGFARLRRNGASVIPLRPVYPSLCLPNIYSMFTGVYPHHHGLVGNENYDPALNVTFNKTSPGLMSRLHTELGVETLWDALAGVGRRSLLYYLPGCSSAGSQSLDAVCARAYQTMAPLEEVKTALLEGAESMRTGYADLVVLYVDLLDWAGHRFGPESGANRRRILRQIDALVSLATSQIIDSSWGASVGAHLLVVGDHGMAKVARPDRTTLQQFAKHDDVLRVVHVGAAVGVWPVPGRNQSLWQMMQLMQSQHPQVEVLTDAQIIRRFYPRVANQPDQPSASRRLPPISVLAEPGIFVETFYRHFPSYGSGPAGGWHGYDPVAMEMHTAVLLAGPRVWPGRMLQGRRNSKLSSGGDGDAIESLDLYPLMRHLLGLSTDASNANHKSNNNPDRRIWRRQASSRLLNDLLLQSAMDSTTVSVDSGKLAASSRSSSDTSSAATRSLTCLLSALLLAAKL